MTKHETRALTKEEVQAGLDTLPGWSISMGHLYREFTYPDFVQAFGFITRVALISERAGHHPEWSSMYGTVQIRIASHDVQGISERDFSLAREIAAIAEAK